MTTIAKIYDIEKERKISVFVGKDRKIVGEHTFEYVTNEYMISYLNVTREEAMKRARRYAESFAPVSIETIVE